MEEASPLLRVRSSLPCRLLAMHFLPMTAACSSQELGSFALVPYLPAGLVGVSSTGASGPATFKLSLKSYPCNASTEAAVAVADPTTALT